jgi:hypothetical protein
VPPLTQQFQELNNVLDFIHATTLTSQSLPVYLLDITGETPILLQLEGEKVSIADVHVIDSLPPPVEHIVQSAVAAKELVFTDLPPQVEFVRTREVVAKKAKERKPKDAPLADDGLRRRTRGSAAKEGYRVPPITDIAPKLRKRARKVVPAVRGDLAQVNNAATDQDQDKNDVVSAGSSSTPQIPIKTPHHIGQLLEIEPKFLSDKLTTVSGEDLPSASG